MANIKQLQQEIRDALSDAFGSVWTTTTKYGITCVEHCNEHNHSPDLVHFMAGELRTHENGGGVYLKAYTRAVRLICARELKWDGDKKAYTSEFHKEEWAKLQAEEFKYLAQLKKDGLGSFKPPKGANGKGKNGKATQGVYQVLCKDIAEQLEKVKDVDAEHPKLIELRHKLNDLLIEAKELNEMTSKLAATMKPKGGTVEDDASNDEEAAKEAAKQAEIDALKAQLEALAAA